MGRAREKASAPTKLLFWYLRFLQITAGFCILPGIDLIGVMRKWRNDRYTDSEKLGSSGLGSLMEKPLRVASPEARSVYYIQFHREAGLSCIQTNKETESLYTAEQGDRFSWSREEQSRWWSLQVQSIQGEKLWCHSLRPLLASVRRPEDPSELHLGKALSLSGSEMLGSLAWLCPCQTIHIPSGLLSPLTNNPVTS